MSDDIVTTAHVCQVFSNKPGSYYAKQQAIFDRWLLDHDAATRTAALEEAAVIAESAGPYRYLAVAAIRAAKAGDS